jgi:hypothetical protein
MLLITHGALKRLQVKIIVDRITKSFFYHRPARVAMLTIFAPSLGYFYRHEYHTGPSSVSKVSTLILVDS